VSSGVASGARGRPRRARRFPRLVLAAIAVGTIGLLAATGYESLLPRREVRIVRPIPIAASLGEPGAASGDSDIVAQAAGWVEPDPYPTHLAPLVAGRILEVHVISGDAVAKDQPLVTLDDYELAPRHDAARAEHEAARREVDAARDLLELARREHELAPGLVAAVKRSEAAHEGAVEEARHRAAAIGSALAGLEIARLVESREEALAARGIAGDKSLELARAGVRRAEGEVAAARADAAAATARTTETAADRDAASVADRERFVERRIVLEAEAALAVLEARVARSGAALAVAERELASAVVRAPHAGIVSEVFATPGATVERFAPLLAIFDPLRLRVRVDVPLAQAERVAIGQGASIRLEGGATFEGRVTALAGVADLQKVTRRVFVAIDRADPSLVPDRLCEVRIRGGDAGTTVAGVAGAALHSIPPAALREGRFVLVVSEDGEAIRREVSVRRRDGDLLHVEGLDPSAKIILDADVDEGDRVTFDSRPGDSQ
jgi:multidrug efflux pump subunit AcrA (membrane-fusion protein)